MRPSLTSSSPAMRRSSVDLPQPEGPRSTTNLFFTARKEMPSTAVTAPKRLVTFARTIMPASIKALAGVRGGSRDFVWRRGAPPVIRAASAAFDEHGAVRHAATQLPAISGRRLVPRRAVREPDAAFARRRQVSRRNLDLRVAAVGAVLVAPIVPVAPLAALGAIVAVFVVPLSVVVAVVPVVL